ncbi:MAG: hypothetical protein JWO82_3680 [Akkermansiaceae bacterium]|nr:hypothetical protein [Akkermansiaceae bacterium]
MLSEEIRQEIMAEVRSSFEDRERIIEIFLEELYAPGDLDPDEVSMAVDEAIQAYEATKASWPAVTDCDRLDLAFARLEELGIISLHNAGYTSSDGYEDFKEARDNRHDPSKVRGYCYYHGQDLSRAVSGGGLYLAFGPADPKHEESEGPAIGSIVTQVMEEQGLQVDWNGSFEKRIHLPKFDWKKR